MSDGPSRQPRSLRAYAAEIAVIVFSILLAFTLDRGWDAWQARGEERVALEGLRADFLKNREEVRTQLSAVEGTAEAFVTVLAIVAAPETSGDTLSRPTLGGLFTGNSLDPYTATLDQLESSGQMDLLRDPELRTLLAQWRAETQDARNEQVRFVDLISAVLWPALVDAGYAYPLDSVNWPGVPAAAPQRPAGATLGSPRMDALLRQLALRNFFVRQDLDEARDATEAVLARLDQLLGTSTPPPSTLPTP